MFADVLASRIRIFNKGVEQLVMSWDDVGRSALTIFLGQKREANDGVRTGKLV